MAKYVCDFDQVYSIGEKVSQLATDMSTSINNYSSKIDTDLSSWNGKAKTAFQQTSAEQVKVANDDITYVNELGEFIKQASRKIQELEEQLANMSI